MRSAIEYWTLKQATLEKAWSTTIQLARFYRLLTDRVPLSQSLYLFDHGTGSEPGYLSIALLVASFPYACRSLFACFLSVAIWGWRSFHEIFRLDVAKSASAENAEMVFPILTRCNMGLGAHRRGDG